MVFLDVAFSIGLQICSLQNTLYECTSVDVNSSIIYIRFAFFDVGAGRRWFHSTNTLGPAYIRSSTLTCTQYPFIEIYRQFIWIPLSTM